MHILVTGGTGYTGSHPCVTLMAAGDDMTIVDSLSTNKLKVVGRIENLPTEGLRSSRAMCMIGHCCGACLMIGQSMP